MSFDPLNIPLETNRARQHTWRVLWILAPIFTALFLVYLIDALPGVHDTTSQFKPESTTSTLRLMTNPQNIQQLQAIGHVTPFQNSPHDINDLLAWTNNEMSIHFKGASVVGVTIDSSLEQNIQEYLRKNGLHVESKNKNTLITIESGFPKSKTNIFQLRQILPWCEGTYTDVRTSCIQIRENGIDIFRGSQEPVSTYIRENNTDVLARFHITANSTHPLFQDAFKFESYRTLSGLIEDYGADVSYGIDREGLAFSLFFPGLILTPEESASITKEFAQQYSLSTTVLTIKDGSTFTEIRSAPDTVEFSLIHDESATISLARTRDGHVFRITTTGSGTLIANRDISLNSAENTDITSCLPNATTVVRIQEVVKNTPQLVSLVSQNSLLSKITSLEATKKKTRICWDTE